MNRYLSFGGGVNSTAMLLLLVDDGIEFEAVYADHGADWPETREYVAMLREKGYPITVLQTRRGEHDLYSYYWEHHMLPTRMLRHCTVEYKLKPLHAYYDRPAVQYVGIDAGEAQRVERIVEPERVRNEYPLIERGIDRKGCERIIREHGLPVPMRSGCFICPFQRLSQWRHLRTVHPELYCKARQLENRCNERLRERAEPERLVTEMVLDDETGEYREMTRVHGGYKPLYLAGEKPLDVAAMEDQMDLFGERRPCLCEL